MTADEVFNILQSEMDRRFGVLGDTFTASEAAMDQRLTGMNEFRQALAHQTAQFPTRELIDQRVGSVESALEKRELRIQQLEQWRANLNGRLVAASGLIVIVNLLILISYHGGRL